MRLSLNILAMLMFATVSACGSDMTMPWEQGKDKKADDTPVDPSLDQPQDDSNDLPAATISNLATLMEQLNLSVYHNKGQRGRGVKVAILDNGFLGLEESLGKTLPPGLSVPPTSGNIQADTNHGTKLAELVYALATGQTSYSPQHLGPTLLLLNSNGFTNLRLAINKAIEERADIILYSQVWEYGGNFDGGGFINKEVNRATDAGIIWVNAAGNYGNATYNGKVEVSPTGQVKLPHQDRYVRFEVERDGTPVKIVLSWNDFTDSFVYRSKQNLDLTLEASTGRVMGIGKLIQDGKAHGANEQGYSDHAREIIRGVLKKGTYYLSVEAKTSNFNEHARLRISIDGYGVRLLDPSEFNDSIMVPADNPNVLTVGASDVDFTSWRDDNNLPQKPEVLSPSILSFSNGESYAGSSTAAAAVVGALAVYRSTFGYKTDAELKREISSQLLAKESSTSERNDTDNSDQPVESKPRLVFRLPSIR